MRISDWSSDVCSSDLGQPGLSQRVAGFGEAVLAEVEDGSGKHRAGVTFAHALHKVLDVADAARCDDGNSDAVGDGAGESQVIAVAGDRKGGGEGKSVLVSVDLGGRRVVKKKKI